MWKREKTQTNIGKAPEFRSLWDVPTDEEQRLCELVAKSIVPWAHSAFVDAVTDGDSEADVAFLRAIEPFVAANHERTSGERRKSSSRQQLDIPLDLSDPEQVVVFLMATKVAIGARLFSANNSDALFEMNDGGLSVVVQLSDAQLDAVRSEVAAAGFVFDKFFKPI